MSRSRRPFRTGLSWSPCITRSPEAALRSPEIRFGEGDIGLNAGADRIVSMSSTPATARFRSAVMRTRPRPTRRSTSTRSKAAHGRSTSPCGTAVRFEPGVAQRTSLVPLEVPARYTASAQPARPIGCSASELSRARYAALFDRQPVTGSGWPTPICSSRSPRIAVVA